MRKNDSLGQDDLLLEEEKPRYKKFAEFDEPVKKAIIRLFALFFSAFILSLIIGIFYTSEFLIIAVLFLIAVVIYGGEIYLAAATDKIENITGVLINAEYSNVLAQASLINKVNVLKKSAQKKSGLFLFIEDEDGRVYKVLATERKCKSFVRGSIISFYTKAAEDRKKEDGVYKIHTIYAIECIEYDPADQSEEEDDRPDDVKAGMAALKELKETKEENI